MLPRGLCGKATPQVVGAVIKAIVLSCPFADKVRVGDCIVSINGMPFTNMRMLRRDDDKVRYLGILARPHAAPTAGAPPPPEIEMAPVLSKKRGRRAPDSKTETTKKQLHKKPQQLSSEREKKKEKEKKEEVSQ